MAAAGREGSGAADTESGKVGAGRKGQHPTALPLRFHDLQGHHVLPEGGKFLLLLLLFLVQELDVVNGWA